MTRGQLPLAVGDRVCFRRGYCAAMFAVGRSPFNVGPICAGIEASDRGTIVAFDDETFAGSLLLAEVEWDRGVRQLTRPANLIRATLAAIMSDNARFGQAAQWGVCYDPVRPMRAA